MFAIFTRSAQPVTAQDFEKIKYMALGFARNGETEKLEHVFSILKKPEDKYVLKTHLIGDLVQSAKEYKDPEKTLFFTEKGFDFGRFIKNTPDLEKRIWLMPYPDVDAAVVRAAVRLLTHCIADQVMRSNNQEYIPSFPNPPVDPLNPFSNLFIKSIGAVQTGLVDYFKYDVAKLLLNDPAARLKLLLDTNQLGKVTTQFISQRIVSFTISGGHTPPPHP